MIKRYGEIVRDHAPRATTQDMETLTNKTSDFIEKVRARYPEMVESFLNDIENELSYFLDEDTARDCVKHLEPSGEKWSKSEVLKLFKDKGEPLNTEHYSEDGLYYVMNMVYSDYCKMYGANLKSYIDHTLCFLNDIDYHGRYSKEKWYALKR